MTPPLDLEKAVEAHELKTTCEAINDNIARVLFSDRFCPLGRLFVRGRLQRAAFENRLHDEIKDLFVSSFVDAPVRWESVKIELGDDYPDSLWYAEKLERDLGAFV